MRAFRVLAIVGCLVPSAALAEKVVANQSAKVFLNTGERSKVLLTVDEGTAMVVLGEEGRWLKVRVEGRTGYVPRSVVDVPDDDSRHENRTWKGRGPGVDDRQRGDGSTVGGRRSSGQAPGEVPPRERIERDVVDDVDETDGRKRQIGVRARGGFALLTQAMRSPGGVAELPDNYNLSTPALTVAIGAAAYRPVGESLVVGVRAEYEYASTLAGIQVPMKKTTGIALHTVDAQGVIGYDAGGKRGTMLLARAGVRYAASQITNVESKTENTAKLPAEVVISPTVGVALEVPRLTGKLGVRVSVDAIPVNFSYQQTKNLEDGKSPQSKGAIVGAGLTYRVGGSFDIEAMYGLTYARTSFGEKVMTSQRAHPMGGVARADIKHVVAVGIAKAF